MFYMCLDDLFLPPKMENQCAWVPELDITSSTQD